MPQIAPPLPAGHEPPPNRVRWTRSQCRSLVDAGILVGRYELVDGEIISKMGQNPPHRIGVILTTEWLRKVFGYLRVQDQSSIDVAEEDNEHNEPEPDAAVTAQPTTAYMAGNPGPSDIVLLLEVSDASLRFDRKTKALKYAKARIPEYWILDITGRQLFVCRQPSESGYGEVVVYAPDETVATLARPDAAVKVSDLLPPAQEPQDA